MFLFLYNITSFIFFLILWRKLWGEMYDIVLQAKETEEITNCQV